jgi:CRP-like cAMP-binding protein
MLGSEQCPDRPKSRGSYTYADGYLGGWRVTEEIGGAATKTFQPGEVIFREGDETQGEAYLVHEGTVEARRLVDGTERLLNTLVKGDLLGEVALFREGPHSVTATAIENVTLVVIPARRLENMVRTNPELAIGLIRQLARMAAGKDSGQGSGS